MAFSEYMKFKTSAILFFGGEGYLPLISQPNPTALFLSFPLGCQSNSLLHTDITRKYYTTHLYYWDTYTIDLGNELLRHKGPRNLSGVVFSAYNIE